MKRLYRVTVTYEYGAAAESEKEAASYAAEAARDGVTLEDCAEASEVSKTARINPAWWLPAGRDNVSLVYGCDENTTWDEAVEKFT